MGRSLLALTLAAVSLVFAPAIAHAGEETVWICKPGQADDLCAGTIEGETLPPPGEEAQPLGYTRPAEAPVDCFYLYPTQSEQPGPNANLEKDPPIRRVVVQQARMFSTVCDVYAPMYRQVTLNGDQSSYNPSVESAYQSAKAAFEDFLENHNGDRPFMMLGHSQGSAHAARLIDELVDDDSELRKRFVGAIVPGANIPVPVGEAIGGLFDDVPACTEVGEFGCVIAFSTYNDVPGPTARFSRVDTGYWIYPRQRFDADEFEVMCTNPAVLDGGTGDLEPLVNFDYLVGVPANETAAPWRGQPDYYRAECMRQGGSHWLNLSKVGLEGDTRLDLGAAVAEGSNYHVPEVNLAEGNLLEIARLQVEGFEQARTARLEAKLESLRAKLERARKRLRAHLDRVERLTEELKETEDSGERQDLKRKLEEVREKARAERDAIDSLKRRIANVQGQLG